MENHKSLPGKANLPGNANLPIDGLKKPGNANLQIGRINNATRESGAPGKNATLESGGPRWHSRGYLPHYDGEEAIQHVTFHLSDSLPKEVVFRLEEELKVVPPEKQDEERRKKVEDWIDAGLGSCVLREPYIAQMVEDALLFFDAQRYRLIAWVVMPNHVHVLFQALQGWTVSEIVASWKKFTARKINEYLRKTSFPGNANLQIGALRKSGNANLQIGAVHSAALESGAPGPGNANLQIGASDKAGNANLPIGGLNTATQESGVPSGGPGASRIWHREYWDRYIRDNNHFKQAVEYIHQNPVKAGLAAKAEDWPWSSARHNAGKRNANLEIGSVKNAGNANLPIGSVNTAALESGDPGPGNANLEIGDPRVKP